MISILCLIMFFLGLFSIYFYCARFLGNATKNMVNSLEMQICTSTNNSDPPIGDVLSGLDEEIRGDMRGYMVDVYEGN